MDEPRVSPACAVAIVLWSLTLTLLLVAWMTWVIADREITAVLIAETACVVSAAAAAAQVRIFAGRLSRLIRVASGLQRPDAEVRDLTPR